MLVFKRNSLVSLQEAGYQVDAGTEDVAVRDRAPTYSPSTSATLQVV